MVKNIKKPKLYLIFPTKFDEIEKKDLKWSSIKLSEVMVNQNRLEASVFDIEAKRARKILLLNKYQILSLVGDNGFCTAYHRTRFKRIFLPYSEYPIFQPSQITEIYPKPEQYISEFTKTNIDALRVKKHQILMTCSGTVGKLSIVGKNLNNQIFSHDLIRINSRNNNDLGYVFAYLSSEIGQLILKSNEYGSVISHIEPEHLRNIPVPNPPDEIKKEIHELIIKSYDLRDESNDLIDEAEKLLIEELKLPPIDKFKPKKYDTSKDLNNFNIKLSKLNSRLDASYHIPIVDEIIKHLKKYAEEVTTLSDPRISKKITLPGRFKRVYVDKEHGVVFIGSKQILELDPTNKKYLSITHHNKRIKDQLIIKQNMILISCSGTIGKIQIAPKHWEKWAFSQHVLRVEPFSDELSGYIYIWLNSEYGKILIKRFTYGMTVDEIDIIHVSNIHIPILKNKDIQSKINDLVLQSNEKRYQAYLLEQKAINKINDEVIFAK